MGESEPLTPTEGGGPPAPAAVTAAPAASSPPAPAAGYAAPAAAPSAAPAPPQAVETVEQSGAGSPAVPDNAAAESADAGEDSLEPLPLEAEPTGIIGLGAKMLRSKGSEIAENERVRRSVDYIKDQSSAVSKAVAESEKVQAGVSFVKNKATEISESESFQKSVEYAKEKGTAAAAKASEVKDSAVEKSKQGLEFAKEKTKGLQEGAGKVWESGRGNILRVKASVSNLSWQGSARDTLDIAAREEQWKGIKIQGAEELTVPARTEHTCCYHVSKGSTLRWTFRVKEHDIGFGVRMRVQEWGGSREDEVLAVDRYDSTDTISGSWVADEDRTMVLVFENKYSKLRSKTVAYFTGTEKPPVFVEVAEPALPFSNAAPAAVEAVPAAAAPAVVEAPVAAVPVVAAAVAAPVRPIV